MLYWAPQSRPLSRSGACHESVTAVRFAGQATRWDTTIGKRPPGSRRALKELVTVTVTSKSRALHQNHLRLFCAYAGIRPRATDPGFDKISRREPASFGACDDAEWHRAAAGRQRDRCRQVPATGGVQLASEEMAISIVGLPPGKYKASASLMDFVTASATIDVAGRSTDVALDLAIGPQSVNVVAVSLVSSEGRSRRPTR